GIGSWGWYCKQAGEELSGSLVFPKPPGFQYSSVYTGCFGDGPGVIDTNNGTLCFSTENFRVNTTYEFTVIGSKPPNRMGRATMQLVTTSSIAPTFSIKCSISYLCHNLQIDSSNLTRWFIIDSDDLYVTTFMQSGTLSSDMLINWDIREMYPNGSLLPFNQTRQDAYTKGTLTPSWYISKEYFINRSDNVSGCVVCATLSKINHSGTSCLRFEYLPRPTPGICTYTLENTKMCVDCLNFTSTISSLKYTFYVMNSSTNLVLVSGNLSKTCFTVPYMQSPLDACVQVSDKFGGSIEVCYANIFIQTKPLEVMHDIVQSLADKNNTVLNRLIVTGQLSASAASVTSYASTVHMLSTLETLNSTGTYNASTATINRDLRSLVIQQLVDVVNNFVPTDSDSFTLTTSSVKEILVNTLDVDRSSQSKLNTYLMNITQSLKTITFDSTIKLLEVTGTVFESALLLAEAGNKQINNPISLDIPKDPATLDYNVDLEKAGLQTSGLDPMFDLMLQNSAEQQSLLVSQTLDVINKLMNTAQHIIQDLLTQGAPPIEFQTSNGVISLYKIPPSDLPNKISVETNNETNVIINNLCDNLRVLNKSCSESYTLQTYVSTTNLFAFRTGSPLPIPSDTQTVSINVYDTDLITIQNAKEIVEVTVRRSSNFKQPIFTSMDPGTNRPQLPAVRIAVDRTEVYQALLMSQQVVPNDVAVVFQLFPENIHECPQYLLFLRLIDPPVISLASGGYDMWTTLPEDTSQCVNMTTNPNDPNYKYTFMLDNRQLMNLRSAQQYRERIGLLQKSVAQTVYIGFRQLNQYEINAYNNKHPPSIPYPYRDQINNTALSRWFLTSCLSGKLDSSKQWSTNKCRVGPMTTFQQTQCICDELSTFTSGWFELPNTIDFNYIFANMDFSKNPTLYATEISIGILFLLIFIWARREDIKDIDRLSVTQLAENNPDHEYLYEIIVSTGHRRCAGTDSKVCFILSGQYCETGCRVLQDPNRKVLCRGSTDRFLLACPKPLGPLIYIRLWHDNSGVGDKASWYCNYVGVVDLQTKEKSHFIVESWFAVEEDDGQVDRIIPVTSQEEMLTFTHLFSTTASRNMTEEHLWISVVARPVQSRFTRVERLACCLLLLYLSMLGSCMFYKGEGAVKQPDIFSLGPFAFNESELYVGIINNILTFIPLFLIAYIFRHSRLRVSHATKLRDAVEEHLDEKLYLGKASFVYSNPSKRDGTNKDDDPEAFSEDADKTTIKRRYTLYCGWQLRILAWLLLILCLGVAVAFTTFYGVMFGEATCKKWLSSLFLSFFISIFLQQPIKVVLLALFFSCICKSAERADELEIFEEENRLIQTLGKRYQLKLDEEYLNNNYLSSDLRPHRLIVLPPDQSDLVRARAYRLKQRRANDIVREVLLYVLFLTLLLVVILDFRDSNGFLLKSSLEKSFFSDTFKKMNDVDDFYKWAHEILIPGLRAERWYNRNPPLFQRGYLEDRTNRIIGYAMMRQLRTKKDSCEVHELAKHLFKHCYASYDMFNEDKETYGISWTKFQGNEKSNNSAPEYVYQNSSQLKGYPYLGQITWYSGGGYVHLLRGSKDEMLDMMSYLNETHWIEFSTRAIIIQFTVYNPNVNLFAIITALVEMPGIGSLIPSYRIETANLFGSGTETTQITFQALFAFILFCYLIKEIRNIFRQRLKYFTRFWNFVELFIIFGSIAAIAAYIYMILSTKSSVEEFSRTHGNIFMNFQLLAYWNENLTYLTAVICFFAMLKLVFLFRFNYRIGLLGSVLKYAAKDLKYFCFIFLIVFSAFVVVFYLLYNDTLSGFKTILNAIETSMQIILGKFDFTSMYERQMVLGPLLFAAFSLCVVFVMVCMFIAILDESFHSVLNDLSLQSDDHEMSQFIAIQFIHWTKLDRTAWGKNFIKNVNTQQQEPIYDPESESTKHVTQLKLLMDEFLEYVQQNLIAEETKSVNPK
ncbi:Polycystin-2, partial [Schistosoma japonicum]